MSKRFSTNLVYSERKKAKLDVSVSNHHLPLSQNSTSSNKENDLDNWGDENEDEMLLQISQQYEEKFADISILPTYSGWEPPERTSTQCQPAPSTSSTPFKFKKPSSNPPSVISTHLKNKCNTISSPLPGIANKLIPETNSGSNLTEDLIINAKMMTGPDKYGYSHMHLRQQEENEKLRAEYDKLQEKCVTKEGEASILRTQLKACQIALDNARMEKTRAQEKVKMEYAEKLAAEKKQLSDLQTQLEFKNLEIISVKEKCKKLESGKKLTQVTVSAHDISSSYRNNHTVAVPYDTSQYRTRVTTSSAQTDNKAPFLKLNKTPRKGHSKLSTILPYLLEPTQQEYSLLDYNEKLQTHSHFSQNKSIVVTTFNRMPSTPIPVEGKKEKASKSNIIEDLVHLVVESGDLESCQEKCFHFFGVVHAELNQVVQQLEQISRRVTTSFLKEMDEKYIEATSTYHATDMSQLLKGGALYKHEQGVVARRRAGALAALLGELRALPLLRRYDAQAGGSLLDTVFRICQLIDHCSCGVPYTGLLISLTLVVERITQSGDVGGANTGRCVRALVSARGAPRALPSLLRLLRAYTRNAHKVTDTESNSHSSLAGLCAGNATGNLKVDYDQGLQLYKTDSCHFQVLLKQTEVFLKCVEKQNLQDEAVEAMDHLTVLFGTLSRDKDDTSNQGTRCECQVMLMQVLVYCLRICTVMLDNNAAESSTPPRLLSACRSGVRALYSSAGAGAAPLQRPRAASLLAAACDVLKRRDTDELYDNMVTELMSTYQLAAEDAPAAFHKEPWLLSFENFSVAD